MPRKTPAEGMVGLRRGIELIELLAAYPEGLGFADLRIHFGDLSPSTCSRLLKTLIEEDLVDNRGDDKRYRLGPRSQRLAGLIAGRAPVAERIGPVLVALARATGHSAVFVERRGDDLVIAAKHEMPEAFHYSPVGGVLRYPAEHGCAKVCLAHMPDDERQAIFARPGCSLPKSIEALESDCAAIRDHGFLINDPDDQPGLVRIAAPVLADEHFLGALGISFFQAVDDHQQLADTVRDTAARAGRMLATGIPACTDLIHGFSDPTDPAPR